MTNEEQRQVLKRRAYERCLRNLALRLAKAGLAEAELAAEIRLPEAYISDAAIEGGTRYVNAARWR